MSEEYFEFLYGGESGMAVIVLKDRDGELTNQKFFAWPEQRPELLEYVAQHAHEDVYTCDALFSRASAKKSAVRSLSMVQADADEFPPSAARLEPSVIVHTSEGKTHLHWKITDSTDPDVLEPLAHGVSQAHPKATEGLDNGWARNKLLRVPGTANLKYAEPYTVTAEYTGAVYTREEFATAYPPVATFSVMDKARGNLPTRAQALSSITSTPTLHELLDRKYAGAVDRSDGLHLLINELFRAGATDEAAFVLTMDHPWNKFRSDEHLWEDILRTRAKAGIEDDDEHEEATVTVAARKQDKTVDFLYPTEKDSLGTTFIDQYLAWATSKTDAHPEFHIAAAFTILSCVFSDHGHATPMFGKLPLNLWFMVLGETTRSRKSTSKRLMLQVLGELSDGMGGTYNYDLGSDFTAEALDNALLPRPNRSALIHVDEIQALLDAMEKKNYLGGMKGKLTELFDGYVNGKLRATGEKKQQGSVPTSFVLFAMGIRSEVADVMSEKDFASGFLARFVYVQTAAPKRDRNSDWLAQADPQTIAHGDPVLHRMAEDLRLARKHWESFHTPGEPTVAVPCTDEAWKRLNDFITDVLDAAEGHERHRILEAGAQRLALSILKAATLLAMHECCDKVHLTHMLTAINYGASWFSHLVYMAEQVSSSKFRKMQKQVLDFLFERGTEVSWADTRRRFRDWGNREFLETVQAIVEAGLAYQDPKKKLSITDLGVEAAA